MNNFTKILICTLLAGFMIILSNGAFAQVPQGMNYQAIARDNLGHEITGQLICLRVSIHTGSVGPVVYQENDTATTNNFGLFTIKIGMGIVQMGTFNTINWSTGNQYMQVEIDITGACTTFTNLGTSQLLTVPYAMYAGTSIPGPTGATGAAGVNGITGATGATGINGINGTTGATGATGTNGTNGSNGATGATGAIGNNGSNGLNGATGATGPTGSSGASGDQYTTTSTTTMSIALTVQNFTVGTGLAYSLGQTVVMANTINDEMIGTVLSYNSSTGAMTVSVTSIIGSGIFSSWNVSLTAPIGPTGPTGAVGATGPQGIAGANGTNGATGPTGATGINGSNGLNGATGPTGATGNNGTNGLIGATGHTGATGNNGSDG